MKNVSVSCSLLIVLGLACLLSGSGAARPRSPPQVRIQPRYIEAVAGEPAEFFCIVEANPTPRISWLR